ncbi:uncharacterized protein LOC143460237 isoform X2 [Clavelina lepadiformis]|uniref:uncharacterized protein LOC143460237 isoform X2 n=1 Tax=Clavelina lepadiformis TaxID=159417 RepID=UPI004042C2EF
MEETRNEASGENKLFEDKETPTIGPSDHASSSSLFISPAAPELLQQPHSIRASPTINWSSSETATRRDRKPTATISAERSGHSSEATARSFPMDPQGVESTIEPSDRASSSAPVPWSDSTLPPYYELMTSPLQNEVISPFSEGQTSTLTAATNSACSGQATVTNTTPAKRRKQVWRKSRAQLEILRKELKLNPALSKQRKAEIALKTELPEKTVQTWFNTNRHKMKVKMNENTRNPSNQQEVFHKSGQQASSSSSVLPSTSHEHDTEVSPQAEIVINYSPPASGSCSNTDDVSNIVRFQQENSHASN